MVERSGTPMVAMDGVQKWFGDLHVLQDIDLHVMPGEAIVPSLMVSSRLMVRHSVDLPEPDGPMTTTFETPELPELDECPAA